MNAAEALRKELVNSSLFDKQKVLDTVVNGIKKNGGICEIYVYWRLDGCPVRYHGDYIECGNPEVAAIVQYLKAQGFTIRKNFHPVSGNWCGYIVSL